MTASEQQHSFNIEAVRARFGWVRFITGLCTGAFTLLIGLEKFFHWDVFQARIVCSLLSLSIVLGSIVLLQEGRILSRSAKALFLIVQRDQKDSTIFLEPAFSVQEMALFRAFHFSFLASIVAMLAMLWLP